MFQGPSFELTYYYCLSIMLQSALNFGPRFNRDQLDSTLFGRGVRTLCSNFKEDNRDRSGSLLMLGCAPYNSNMAQAGTLIYWIWICIMI
jgi:hypothetical protein